MRKPIIKTGDKYNRLTVIRFHHKNKRNYPYWLFKCDCGAEKIICVYEVKRGRTKSCGCLQKELLAKRKTTHGMRRTREYKSWDSIKQRCFNKNDDHFKNYGDRGIVVCNRWLGKSGFQNFYEDMGKRPERKTIDRIDNNRNYEPNNCRWATPREQQMNRRKSIFVSVNNVQISLSELAEMFGIKRSALYVRLFRLNWTLEKALGVSSKK